ASIPGERMPAESPVDDGLQTTSCYIPKAEPEVVFKIPIPRVVIREDSRSIRGKPARQVQFFHRQRNDNARDSAFRPPEQPEHDNAEYGQDRKREYPAPDKPVWRYRACLNPLEEAHWFGSAGRWLCWRAVIVVPATDCRSISHQNARSG